MTEQFGLSGQEKFFDSCDIIVSKTDTRGIITYANDVFLEIADFKESEVMGKPHNIIRHDFMPKAIYKLFWNNLQSGNEILAYVVNRTKHNDYYWVLANATPSFDDEQNIKSFHSNRRVPNREAINFIAPIYMEMKKIEQAAATTEKGIEASFQYLVGLLEEKHISYEELIFKLQQLQPGETV